jgi:hypothetical protein
MPSHVPTFRLYAFLFVIFINKAKILLTLRDYIEINTWPFPYQPGYHPETPISALDAVEGRYESRDDSRDDMEKVMY